MFQPPVPGPPPPGVPRRSAADLSAWLFPAMPIIFGLFMLIASPTYFRPMIESALGWQMLLFVFTTLWLILLGPAIVILYRARGVA